MHIHKLRRNFPGGMSHEDRWMSMCFFLASRELRAEVRINTVYFKLRYDNLQAPRHSCTAVNNPGSSRYYCGEVSAGRFDASSFWQTPDIIHCPGWRCLGREPWQVAEGKPLFAFVFR
jgi:hypothetical protein